MRPYTMISAGGFCGVIGAMVALLVAETRHEVLVPMPMVITIERPQPAPTYTSELQLVFRAADATYMKLAPAAGISHGPLTLYDREEIDDWQTFSIGEVADAGIYQHWLGKRVLVDGTCEAAVVGFAIVGRLLGKPDYAPGDHAQWTADNVLEFGAPVLAAKLDACTGTFARARELPLVITPLVIEDETHIADRAREKLLSSVPARAAQYEWINAKREGEWKTGAEISTIVVRHPLTNVVWVSVHARMEEGCDAPDINLWGLYRVDGDALATEQQRALGDLHSIDRLIDIEGDGALEVIGKPWHGTDTVIARPSGDELMRLELPFYGCSC